MLEFPDTSFISSDCPSINDPVAKVNSPVVCIYLYVDQYDNTSGVPLLDNLV